MKNRHQILWSVVIIALLIALALLFRKKQSAVTPFVNPMDTNAAQQTAAGMSRTPTPLLHTNPSAAQSISSAHFPVAAMEDKEQQMREGLATLNNQDIFLYGRVVDQFDAPVPNATVAAVIGVNNGTKVEQNRISAATDENGLFTISGCKGKDMGIDVAKAGYVLASTNTYFIYSLLWPESKRFVPDPNNPLVIKMWKLQGEQPLVAINQTYKVHFTNAPIFFDLLAGRIVSSGGDLEIAINRPDGIISQQHPQDWSIQLTVIDGGFIDVSPSESAVTFAAPEGGYQQNGIFSNNNGPDLVDKTFFVRSRDGQAYSKIHFVLGINNAPDEFMDISIKGVANANSSRNWEATTPR